MSKESLTARQIESYLKMYEIAAELSFSNLYSALKIIQPSRQDSARDAIRKIVARNIIHKKTPLLTAEAIIKLKKNEMIAVEEQTKDAFGLFGLFSGKDAVREITEMVTATVEMDYVNEYRYLCDIDSFKTNSTEEFEDLLTTIRYVAQREAVTLRKLRPQSHTKRLFFYDMVIAKHYNKRVYYSDLLEQRANTVLGLDISSATMERLMETALQSTFKQSFGSLASPFGLPSLPAHGEMGDEPSENSHSEIDDDTQLEKDIMATLNLEDMKSDPIFGMIMSKTTGMIQQMQDSVKTKHKPALQTYIGAEIRRIYGE